MTKQTSLDILGSCPNTVKVTWIALTLPVYCCQVLTSSVADLVLDSNSPVNGFTKPQMNCLQ